MSALCGEPYLPRPAPPVAPVREQRAAPAPAGDVLFPVNSAPPLDLRALRRQLRAARRAVPPAQRRAAGVAIARLVAARHWLRPGQRVALFLSMPEEIDTQPLLRLAQSRRCHVHVPRISDRRHGRMVFLPLSGPMGRGSFGIREPVGGRPLRAIDMQLIFAPLVGFDDQGNRIGMGRGYYDRALAFRRRHTQRSAPRVVGVAYDCQRVSLLPVQPHDVPLDVILTPSGLRRFARPTSP